MNLITSTLSQLDFDYKIMIFSTTGVP